MISEVNFNRLRKELAVEAKNGIDFCLAAAVVWAILCLVWMSGLTLFSKCLFSFYISTLLLPLAFCLSKLLKTQWQLKHNPLQPLGLWLNFAQLFYFPLLFFSLYKAPDYFIMIYAVITGAHLFPYSWYYRNPFYAVAAGVSSLGSFFLSLRLSPGKIFFIPLFMSFCFVALSFCLTVHLRKRSHI
ncbi:MAG TPA: hypothetical protein VFR58_09810 [Flavisolibacter sp.]|nr:hypothetical protein [Flavisolibacter sp.]